MSQILSLDSRESQETNKGGISFRLDLTALNVPLHKLRTDSSDAPAQSLGFSASSCERAASPPGVWEGRRTHSQNHARGTPTSPARGS